MPYPVKEGNLTSRAIAIASIVLMHLGMFTALKASLARQPSMIAPGPLDVRIIQENILPEEAPPPPPVHIETPPPFIPMPEVRIDLPPNPEPIMAATQAYGTTELPPVPVNAVTQAPLIQRPVKRTELKFDPFRSPSTEDYYPPISRRMGEEGSTVVGVCVGPDGRPIGQIKLDRTSGSARLDEAAEKYVLRTRWIPATENGEKIQSCTALSVKFVLKE